MTRVTLDEALISKLHDLTTDVELCDADGRVLARLTPSTPWTDPENWSPAEPPLTDEEIQRRHDSDEPTYTTQEVIDRLKAL